MTYVPQEYRRRTQRKISGSVIAFACLSIFFFIFAWAAENQNGFVDFWHIPIVILGLVLTVYLLRRIFQKTSRRTKEAFGRQPMIVGGLFGIILFFVIIIQWQLTEEGLGQIPMDPTLMLSLSGIFAVLTVISLAASLSRMVNTSLDSFDIIGARKFVGQTLERQERRKRHKLR